MSVKEDEYYSGKRDRGIPLCPFCGSKQVYPIREKRFFFFMRTVAWSCANEKCRMYRKRFPNPSWGPGQGNR